MLDNFARTPDNNNNFISYCYLLLFREALLDNFDRFFSRPSKSKMHRKVKCPKNYFNNSLQEVINYRQISFYHLEQSGKNYLFFGNGQIA